MKIEQMTIKELLALPVRPWDIDAPKYDSILFIPSGLKHESGYMCIAIIGIFGDQAEICGYPDDVSLFADSTRFGPVNEYQFASVRMDSLWPSGAMRYHGNGTFMVSRALSSQDITFIPNKK